MTAGAQGQTTVPVIRMENVAIGSLHDPTVPVAEEIHWQVNAGDYWVIAGLQGSGKSDFLMVTGSVMAPVQGQYWFLGQPMPVFEGERLRHRLRLGLVFDGGQLFTHLTVRENVSLPLRYHQNLSKAEVHDTVQQMLEALELGPWADSTPGAIGRNWQKRVGMARALILRPELLLIDNPLAGLDLRHGSWWLHFLSRLSAGDPLMENRPVTLVVTTADLRPWKGRARQFAILRHKRLTVLGTWQQLESASQELVQELLMTER